MYTVTLTKETYYTLIDTMLLLPRGQKKTLEKYSSLGTVSQENGYLTQENHLVFLSVEKMGVSMLLRMESILICTVSIENGLTLCTIIFIFK